jgi:aromatic ring-opening dioxygenase catalytic subunit (LigB family)
MKPNKTEDKARVLYISHGGGPLPILGDVGHKAMVDFMKQLPAKIGKPEAILVISAHWEEKLATLLGAQRPPMFYDYYGFLEEAYEITYEAPGNPLLANRIADLLQKRNIPATIDSRRGFDHGLFIPLKLMYPDADIPTIQLSLVQGLDAALHIALGKAIRELMLENILVIGSGFSFHNMHAFSWKGVEMPDPDNDNFQNWLIGVCTGQLAQSERKHQLTAWERAPSARYCHPREEHLLPLQVCLGLAGKSARVIFDDYIMGKRAVAFLW